MTDANNGYLVAFGASTSTIKLFKIVAGVYTQLGGNVSATMTDGQTLGITVVGTSISAVLNGTTVLTVTDSTFTTGTYAGLRVGGASSAIRYDNFNVQ
jgi:ABC-type enterobactin transport system permease subunit